MHIFGDPLRMPIVMVERVMNAPRRTTSQNSYLRHFGLVDSHSLQTGHSSDTVGKKSAPENNSHVLKIVVFVHGFQACLALMKFTAKQYVAFHVALELVSFIHAC